MKTKSNPAGRMAGLLLAAWLAAPVLAENPGASTEGKASGQDISYKLIPGDTLNITTPNEPALTGDNYVISADGTIKVWLLGDVLVKGLNAQQVEDMLNKKLEKDYIKEPFVRVSVFKYRRRTVTVNGDVGKPGSVEFYGDKLLRLPEAIASAGGWTKTSSKAKITIIRGNKTIHFNYGDYLKNPLNDPPVLEDGDVVEVGQSFF